MTRDSVVWVISMIGSAAVGLVGHFDWFPWLSPSAQHTIEIIAFLYGIVAGKMASSPLAHSDDLKLAARMSERP